MFRQFFAHERQGRWSSENAIRIYVRAVLVDFVSMTYDEFLRVRQAATICFWLSRSLAGRKTAQAPETGSPSFEATNGSKSGSAPMRAHAQFCEVQNRSGMTLIFIDLD